MSVLNRMLRRASRLMSLSTKSEAIRAKFDSARRLKYEEAAATLKYKALLSNIYQNPLLRDKFLELPYDAEAEEFLTFCFKEFTKCSYTSLVTRFVRPWLARCMGHSNVNGLLGVGQMHLLSTEQLRIILGLGGGDSKESKAPKQLDRVLDIGAGDGRVTRYLAPLFKEVVTTEVSDQMVKRLRSKGFKCVQTGDIRIGLKKDGGYDVICLFNVIDRCNRPRALMQDIRPHLRTKDSRVVLATPLPLNPWVENGTRWVRPAEDIGRRSCCFQYADHSWEDAVRFITEDYFTPLGYTVQSVSRVPYLSQGDSRRAYYVLDDAIFVLTSNTDGKDAEDAEAAARGGKLELRHGKHHGGGGHGGAGSSGSSSGRSGGSAKSSSTVSGSAGGERKVPFSSAALVAATAASGGAASAASGDDAPDDEVDLKAPISFVLTDDKDDDRDAAADADSGAGAGASSAKAGSAAKARKGKGTKGQQTKAKGSDDDMPSLVD